MKLITRTPSIPKKHEMTTSTLKKRLCLVLLPSLNKLILMKPWLWVVVGSGGGGGFVVVAVGGGGDGGWMRW